MLIPEHSTLVPQEQFLQELIGEHHFTTLLNKPQRKHVGNVMEAVVVTRGDKTAAALVEANPDWCDSSSLTRHLNSKMPTRDLMDLAREGMLRNLSPTTTCHLILDDTHNPRNPQKPVVRPHLRPRGSRAMESVDIHHDHNQGRYIWAHSIVTAHLVAGDVSLPWDWRFYHRREECEATRCAFASKIELACRMVGDFHLPAWCGKLIVLSDSWYTGRQMIEAVRGCETATLIGAIKANALLERGIGEGDGPMKAGDIARQLEQSPQHLDVVTVKGVEYEYWHYKGRLFAQEEMSVVIVRQKGRSAWWFLACTDQDLPVKEILEHYQVRWQIETGYWYLKCELGFGDYRLRSLEGVERFIAEVFLAYWYLEWLRFRRKLASLAEAIDLYQADYKQRYQLYMWRQMRHCRNEQEAIKFIRNGLVNTN